MVHRTTQACRTRSRTAGDQGRARGEAHGKWWPRPTEAAPRRPRPTITVRAGSRTGRRRQRPTAANAPRQRQRPLSPSNRFLEPPHETLWLGPSPSPSTAERSALSASGTVSARPSSPSVITVSGWGSTWPSRMIATIVASGGSRSSYRGRPADGESGGPESTIEIPPRSSGSRRTRSPTVTSSSTIAVRMCGGETAASTPHCSVNSHSLSGWFTREHARHAELLLRE